MSCGGGHRLGSDPALLWLWHTPAATAPVRLLAWEPPYAMGAALEKAKKDKNKQTNKKIFTPIWMKNDYKQLYINEIKLYC